MILNSYLDRQIDDIAIWYTKFFNENLPERRKCHGNLFNGKGTKDFQGEKKMDERERDIDLVMLKVQNDSGKVVIIHYGKCACFDVSFKHFFRLQKSMSRKGENERKKVAQPK